MPALFYGLALSKDGSTLYVSDGGHDGAPPSEIDQSKHYNIIEVFSTGLSSGTPQLTKLDAQEIHLAFNGSATARRRAIRPGLALSADEKAALRRQPGRLHAGGGRSPAGATTASRSGARRRSGVAPYDVSSTRRRTPRSSLWGGRLDGGVFDDGVVAGRHLAIRTRRWRRRR